MSQIKFALIFERCRGHIFAHNDFTGKFYSLQCVQESLMMIPDCHRRLEKAVGDLKALVSKLTLLLALSQLLKGLDVKEGCKCLHTTRICNVKCANICLYHLIISANFVKTFNPVQTFFEIFHRD